MTFVYTDQEVCWILYINSCETRYFIYRWNAADTDDGFIASALRWRKFHHAICAISAPKRINYELWVKENIAAVFLPSWKWNQKTREIYLRYSETRELHLHTYKSL